jgi:hypothetical protein
VPSRNEQEDLMRRPFLFILPALSAAVLLSAATASATTFRAGTSGTSLRNASAVTLKGKPNAQGGCTVSAPRLQLAPGQRAIQADQTSIDSTSCSSTWQIGTPASTALPSGADYTSSSSATYGSAATGAAVSAASLVSSSGYERAWTEDLIGLTLTSDKTNISWAWDGTCVRSASGSANWTWSSGSGWGSPYNNGAWISTSCNNSHVWSQASFKNSIFCWPITTYSSYSGVTAQGSFNGTLSGWVNNMSYSGACLPLFLHSQLVRVTG